MWNDTMTAGNYFGAYDFDGRCPRCGGAEERREVSHTLVGWIPPDPEMDPNHWTADCRCPSCGFVFLRNWRIRTKMAWCVVLVEEPGESYPVRYCVAGVPDCCESGNRVACACGGWAEHSHRNRIKSFTRAENTGKMVPTERHYWKCRACGRESDDLAGITRKE